jgi:REP element-mobilizing transposase RayT
VLHQLRAEAEEIEVKLKWIGDPGQRAERTYQEQRRIFGRWDTALHTRSNGLYWLGDPRVAETLSESLAYRDGQVYDLLACCIMPNHVHTVFVPLPTSEGNCHAMSAIMHSLKLYTARKSNRLLGRTGQFWQHENYDRVVRNEAELNRIIRYVLDNPVMAGLVEQWEDWKWSYCKYPL